MGQNINKIEIIKNALFYNSQENINDAFEFYVLNIIDIQDKNYLGLNIGIDNIKCSQFIIKINDFSKNMPNVISVILKDIKLKMIKNKNYLEIKDYKVINYIKNIKEKELQPFIFELPEIIENTEQLVGMKNISIKLKAKEFDLLSSYNYKFYNNYSQNISIDIPKEFIDKFENSKIYLFNGFNCVNNSLKPINVSNIEIYDINSEIISENIKNIKNEEIVNIQGTIKDIYLKKCSVLIEELNSKNNVEIQLNINLIKKISSNNLCIFFNFRKRNDKFIYTNLSDIYSKENTYVEIYFHDILDQYYNIIKINDNYSKKILQNKIKFELDSSNKDYIFEQKFILQRIINQKVESFYEFFLEINKGQINCFSGFLKKNGKHTYQIYFQSKDKNLLPKNINIKVNDKESIKVDIFDSYDNNLRKRLTIINSPEQDFFNQESLDYTGSKINNTNLKLYFLIKNDNKSHNLNLNNNNNYNVNNNIIIEKKNLNEDKISKYIFEYNKNPVEKKEFCIEKEEKEKINKIFSDILKKDKEKYDINLKLIKELGTIFMDNILLDYCKSGFKKYIFKNNKDDYETIKKIIILYIYYKHQQSPGLIKFYFEQVEYYVLQMTNVSYLEKIQILLHLFNNINNKNFISDTFFIDIFEKKNNILNMYYEPCIDAFNLFFDIIDKQTESCSFYQAILQFNGIIKTDLFTGKKMYSGAIHSLKDIKFEIIKTINKFFFIDNKEKPDADGKYYLNFNIIVFYPSSFYDTSNDYKKKDITKKLQVAFLFLIFQEFCGNLKTNINNVESSPKHYLNNDLNLIFTNFDNADSGFIFEHILTNKSIDLKMIIQEEHIDVLFDSKYYIKENFDDLRKIINQISPNILYSREIGEVENKKKDRKKSEGDKQNLKGLPESFIKKLEEVEENLEEYNYHRLYPLFQIPENMTSEEFDNSLKNNKVYKKFKKIIDNQDAKY